MRLLGARAVVTGAGSGIGAAIARRFAAEGAIVAVVDLDVAAAERTARDVRDGGGDAVGFRADVSDEDDVRALFEQVADWADGRLDVLVNNAGILDGFATIGEMRPETWHRVLDVNLTGMFLVTREALPLLRLAAPSAVVNIASIAGVQAGGGGIAYTASKHGVVGLTRQLAIDEAAAGVRVNAILPGAVRTALSSSRVSGDDGGVRRYVPAGRAADPNEIANVALFLASAESSYLYGSAVVADGGLSIQAMPRPERTSP